MRQLLLLELTHGIHCLIGVLRLGILRSGILCVIDRLLKMAHIGMLLSLLRHWLRLSEALRLSLLLRLSQLLLFHPVGVELVVSARLESAPPGLLWWLERRVWLMFIHVARVQTIPLGLRAPGRLSYREPRRMSSGRLEDKMAVNPRYVGWCAKEVS